LRRQSADLAQGVWNLTPTPSTRFRREDFTRPPRLEYRDGPFRTGRATMKWRTGRRSSNVEDRRGRSATAIGGAGGIVVLLVAVAVWLLGGDPAMVLDAVEGTGTAGSQALPRSPEEDEEADFVAVVLADTEDVWQAIFEQHGSRYREPTLTLFTGQVSSACGFNTAATGPFYCPGDERVYLDLAFFR